MPEDNIQFRMANSEVNRRTLLKAGGVGAAGMLTAGCLHGGAGGGGEEGVLACPLVTSPANLEPNGYLDRGSIVAGQNIYERLEMYTPGGQIRPGVAEDVERPDGLTYRYLLHDNVEDARGTAITAEDVKASIEWVQDPDNNSPKQGLHSEIESIDVIDDTTIELTLGEPWAPFRNLMASPAGANITAADTRDVNGIDNQYASNPADIGTGPFQLDNWETGNQLTFTPNPNYWDDEFPKVERLEMPIISETGPRMARFSGQDIDIMLEPERRDVNTLEGMDGVQGESSIGGVAQFVAFMCDKPPFDDYRRRRAVAHATNREAIVDNVYAGRAAPAHHYVHDTQPWRDDDLNEYLEYDLDKAKDFVDESGGSFEFDLFTEPGPWVQSAEVLQQDLAEIGVTANVLEFSHTAMLNQTLEEQRAGLTLQNLPDREHNWPYQIHRFAVFPEGEVSWFTRYEGEEVRDAMFEYLEAPDRDAQIQAAIDLAEITAERCPFYWSVWEGINQFWWDRVQDYQPSYVGSPLLREVSVSN